jgi:3-dehydroquinate dehydratase/shikimate dehydrogenase
VYLPFRIPAGELQKTLTEHEWLDVRGYSVTIPHKQAALEFAQNKDPASVEIGAANTLFRDSDGNWNCSNTDYNAALASLQLGLNRDVDPIEKQPDLSGKRVLMLGAGGVARAVGLGVVHSGGELTITNRTVERAEKLATELNCQYVEWDQRRTVVVDVLVNCTSVGMHPNLDETPYPADQLTAGMLVFDTIYTPEETMLLKQAAERGCPTVSGMEMFVRQAAAQFEQFTARPAALTTIREALTKGISTTRK